MIDLTCLYGGLPLRNPLIVGSSGLTATAAQIIEIARQGAGAVVLKSLFEEQIEAKALQAEAELDFAYPEGMDYVLHYTKQHEVEQYLQVIREAKANVDIPIIASVNCYRSGEWLTFARKIEEAGADALEVNIMRVESDPTRTEQDIVEGYVEIARSLVYHLDIPVTFKVSNHFSSLVNLASRLAAVGLKGLTCFNKSWYTDVNLSTLEIQQGPVLSQGIELYETLKYIGILSARLPQISISASGGVKTAEDMIKAIVVGAQSVQVVSALYEHKIPYIATLLENLIQWMEQKGFQSLREVCGRLNASKQRNQALFERAQFMRYFSSYKEQPVGDI